MKTLWRSLVFLGVVLVAISAQGQTKYLLSVDASTDDDVGKSFVFELKSAIANSGVYRLVDKEQQVSGLQLSVVSLSNQGNDSNNASAAVSVVLTLKTESGLPVLLQHWVVSVGRESTTSMAHRVLSQVDDEVSKLRQALSKP